MNVSSDEMVRVSFTGRHLNRHGQYGPGDGAAFPRSQANAIVESGVGVIVDMPAPPAHKQVTRPPVKRSWLKEDQKPSRTRRRST